MVDEISTEHELQFILKMHEKLGENRMRGYQHYAYCILSDIEAQVGYKQPVNQWCEDLKVIIRRMVSLKVNELMMEKKEESKKLLRLREEYEKLKKKYDKAIGGKSIRGANGSLNRDIVISLLESWYKEKKSFRVSDIAKYFEVGSGLASGMVHQLRKKGIYIDSHFRRERKGKGFLYVPRNIEPKTTVHMVAMGTSSGKAEKIKDFHQEESK